MKFYKENKINPYASCLPIVFQIPIFISLFFVLRDFENEIFPQFPASSLEWIGLVDITEPTKDGWGPVLIAVYVASQLTSTYLMSTAMQSKAQRCDDHGPSDRLPPVHPQLPVRADDLLADDEPVDDGAGTRDAPSHAEAGRSTEAVEPHAAEGGTSRPRTARAPTTVNHGRPRRRAALPSGSSGSAAAVPADERVERNHRRGHRRDRGRGEMGCATRARVDRAGSRPRSGAVPGRLRGRARACSASASRRPM